MTTDFAIEIREEKEQQIISLFRCLLEYFGGKVDCRQHNFGAGYTTNQNASLCANLLGVCYARQFGRFDPEEMQDALLRSKIFAGISMSDLPNTVEWSRRMMISVPIGFSDNYLVQCYRSRGWRTLTMAQNLPLQLLCDFGAREIDRIRCHL